MAEYLIDVDMRVTVRVDAANAAEARWKVDTFINGSEANFGFWPDCEPIVGEINVTGRGIVEQDGEPVLNGRAR